MANFSTQKIEVLFCLCLAKAQVKRARSEYDGLSEVINNSNPQGDPNITQKYLDEAVDKRLLSALKDGLPNVGINRAYLDVLALYLGYESFLNLENSYNRAHRQVSQLSSNQISFYHPLHKKTEAAQIIANLSYPEQASVLNISYSTLPKEPHLFDQEKEIPFTVLWVNQEWIRDHSLDMNINAEETPLFLVSRNEDGETLLQPLTKLEFSLYFQLLHMGINQESTLDSDGKSLTNLGNRPIIIKDSGAINLGTIKAKYISERDMTFNITKNKK